MHMKHLSTISGFYKHGTTFLFTLIGIGKIGKIIDPRLGGGLGTGVPTLSFILHTDCHFNLQLTLLKQMYC